MRLAIILGTGAAASLAGVYVLSEEGRWALVMFLLAANYAAMISKEL